MAYYDAVVVGAGIVGLATARELLRRRPSWRVAVLEKETAIATHQTGRNSNVIHSGLYYQPGSVKARLCVKGVEMLYGFCDEHRVPYNRCGKIIVAVKPHEVRELDVLRRRGQDNNVQGLEIISAERIREIEPHCRGLAALYSPNTGIVDYAQVARALADNIRARGGVILLQHGVKAFRTTSTADGQPQTLIELTQGGQMSARHVVGCAGLFADKIAELAGGRREPPIIGIRGEYTMLKPEFSGLVRGLIYPVKDPAVPFLGVHFTKRMDGGVDLGPNAVLALAREGYHMWDVNWRDVYDMLTYRGTLRLMARHWRFGLGEMYRSLVPSMQLRALQQWVPDLRADQIQQRKPGVRAMPIGPNGELLEDFIFDHPAPNFLNVRSAPSPAATSSLAIAVEVVDHMKLL